MSNHYEFIILGAGPAGLQMGYYMEKANWDYMILDGAPKPGAFFEKFPRRRKLISFNKIHSLYDDPEIRLRWDWNSLLTDDYSFLFEQYSKDFYPHADDLLRYLRGFASEFKLKIQQNTRIVRVSKTGEQEFHLTDKKGREFTCRCLVVATGFSKSFIPEVEGIELVEDDYESVSLDPQDFLGQRVLVIGKGNSAFEIADILLPTTKIIHLASPRPIRFAWNTRFAGNVRADNSRILDSYQLKLLNGGLDCTIERIRKDGDRYVVSLRYLHAMEEREELVYDRVIRCAGFRFDTSIYDSDCTPTLCDQKKLPRSSSCWESESVSNLFFAGTLMQYRDLQKTASAFIDGFRYNIRTLFHFLATRFKETPFPHKQLPMTPEALFQASMDRICTSSGLWAQFGFLGDVMVVDEKAGQFRYYHEWPVDHVHESAIGQEEHYYVITFNWGNWPGDVFAIERRPTHDHAHTNVFLHPIIQRFSKGKLVAEHHLVEDLFGMYRGSTETDTVYSRQGRNVQQYHRDEHEEPLMDFFTKQLESISRTDEEKDSTVSQPA